MGQGEFFALAQEQIQSLLECDDTCLLDSISRIEETWQDSWRQFLGKEWNLLQCCLSDGTCNPSGGTYPLNHCILGGHHLLPPNDGLMAVLVTPPQVVDIDTALATLDTAWLRRRYETLFPYESASGLLEWMDELFVLVKTFYHKAARDRRGVLFTTDETLDAIYSPQSACR